MLQPESEHFALLQQISSPVRPARAPRHCASSATSARFLPQNLIFDSTIRAAQNILSYRGWRIEHFQHLTIYPVAAARQCLRLFQWVRADVDGSPSRILLRCQPLACRRWRRLLQHCPCKTLWLRFGARPQKEPRSRRALIRRHRSGGGHILNCGCA
jgi:hypothetical protein